MTLRKPESWASLCATQAFAAEGYARGFRAAFAYAPGEKKAFLFRNTSMADGPKLTPPEMDRIRQIISHKARKFARSRHDREDAEQEIWLRIVRRLRSYDSARAGLMTFLFHVIESATRDVKRKTLKHSRGPKTTLNEPARQDGSERVAMVSAEAQEFALGHRRNSNGEQVDLALDTAEVIDMLPRELRTLCDLLRESTAAEVADRLQISRATLYRRLHIARKHLEDQRLDQYVP